MKRSALILILLFSLSIGLFANVEWDNALAIRQGVNIEWFRTAAAIDGGIVYSWSDTREGERDLFAQMISPTGQKLWGDTGLLIDNKADRQEDPVIIATSDNCVIIAWVDFSDDPDGNIYAQKINASGTKLWATGGVPLCTSIKIQISLNIVPDTNGGAFVLWSDNRTSNIANYCQHVNGSGQATWQANGIRVAVPEASAGQNSFWEDGQGGAIVTFLSKDNSSITNIYAARIGLNGQFTWGPSPITNFTDNSIEPGSVRIVPDNTGSFIIGWEQKDTNNNSDYDIYTQRIDINGQKLWATNGINVTNNEWVQEKPRLATATDGGAFIIWEDKRYDSTHSTPDLVMQKFNTSGQPAWTNPLSVCQLPEKQAQARLTTTTDGCVVVWEDERNLNDSKGIDIYTQKVLNNGTIVWEENGKLITDLSGNQSGANVKVSNNITYYIWADESNGSLSLSQQIFNANGQPILALNGEFIFSGLSANASKMNIFSYNNYALITWLDERYGNFGYQVFMQKVNSLGQLQFATNGIPVTTDNSIKTDYYSMLDSQGNIVVFWHENIGGYTKPKAQKMSINGERLWGDNGILLSNEAQVRTSYFSVEEINGAFYFYWSDTETSNLFSIIKGQKIVGNQLMWGDNGKNLVHKAPDPEQFSNLNTEVKLAMAHEDYIIWFEDYHTGEYPDGNDDLMIKRIDADGNTAAGWVNNGFPITNVPGYEKEVQILTVPQGIMVIWVDDRNTDNETNIYSQIISPDGQMLLTENGVSLATYPQAQDEYSAKWNASSNKLTVAWKDFRDSMNDNYNVYVQRYDYTNSTLNPLWNSNGVGIAVEDSAQSVPDLALMHQRALVVWEDAFYDHDIYMGMVDDNGSILSNQVEVVHHLKAQTTPKLAKINDNVAYVAWVDGISSGKEEILGIYMQQVSTAGFTSNDNPEINDGYLHVDQNYPNPFNPSTTISFSLQAKDKVSVNIYNVKGQKVKALQNDIMEQGTHKLTWNGKDNNDKDVASGIYYYQVKTKNHTATKKMILMK